jgi:hypothetical protein
MTATIEISLYPLHREYPLSVLRFLKQLRAIPGIEIESNGMSTVIIGELNMLWSQLGLLIASQLSTEESVFILKVVPGRREYLA